MRRIVALVSAMIVCLAMMAPVCLAVKADETNVTTPGFKIRMTSPEDGDTNVAVDNFSVKIYFSKEMVPQSNAVRKSNAAQFKLTDEEGKKVPLKVYYSEKERRQGLMMVAADYSDNNKKNVQIKGASEYTLTIGDKLQATDGSRFNQTVNIKVKTLNQQRSMVVYMILMAAMMGGMIFFTIRSTKRAEEKKKEEVATKGANPYKEAKRTGKSVDEIVAKNKKAKEKQEEAEAKRREAEKALEAEILEQMRREKNKRVSGPAPISRAGSEYKVEVKSVPEKTREETKKSGKGTTNPKNQSGKKKNTGKKSGKKKGKK